MIIEKKGSELSVIMDETRKAYYEKAGYEIAKGKNDGSYVLIDSVMKYILNVSEGNDKIGRAHV